jgi:predicted O-methyltransferase YrrM
VVLVNYEGLSMLSQVVKAIQAAESNGLILNAQHDFIQGFSGDKLIGALQRLTSLFQHEENTCYLEIGVFQGLTLLSVANTCPTFPCYGIDNFAHFDPKGENLSLVNTCMEKLELKNVNLINKDYEDALENLDSELDGKKIGVYFIDGPHDYRSQLMCLALAKPYLHREAIIIIDDCNYRHVRQANRDFLVSHPEYKLIFEAYTKSHPVNMTSLEEQEARRGWWDGVNILVKDIENQLKPIYPPTEQSRLLYENEHIIHASRLAELTPYAVEIAQAIYEIKLIKAVMKIAAFWRTARKDKNLYNIRYSNVNTYSENLPRSNYSLFNF